MKIRRYRTEHFDAHLFFDPAWEMLLDLFIEHNRRPVNLMSLANASNVPTTTAMRHLKDMEDSGLVERTKDAKDKRVVNVCLTPSSYNHMRNYAAGC